MSDRGYAVSKGDDKKYRDNWAQTFGKKKPKEDRAYACEECGCEDVEGTCWIHLNSGEPSNSEPPSDIHWCPACESETSLALFDRNDPKRKNIWSSMTCKHVPVFKGYGHE